MNKQNIIGIGVVLALILGVLGVSRAPVQTTIDKTKTVQVGSVSSPDITSPYLSVNGVRTWYSYVDSTQTSGFNTASTTVCLLAAPNATSTLVRATFKVTTATSTAYQVSLFRAIGIANTATSTAGSGLLLASSTVAASTLADLAYSTSSPSVAGGQLLLSYPSNAIFGPYTNTTTGGNATGTPYFAVWAVNGASTGGATGSAGIRVPAGTCSAIWQEL